MLQKLLGSKSNIKSISLTDMHDHYNVNVNISFFLVSELVIVKKSSQNILSSDSLPDMSMWVKVAQSCLTLCDPVDCSPWNSPGQNTGVGNLFFPQGIFQPRDQTQVTHTAGGFFTSWATREFLEC